MKTDAEERGRGASESHSRRSTYKKVKTATLVCCGSRSHSLTGDTSPNPKLAHNGIYGREERVFHSLLLNIEEISNVCKKNQKKNDHIKKHAYKWKKHGEVWATTSNVHVQAESRGSIQAHGKHLGVRISPMHLRLTASPDTDTDTSRCTDTPDTPGYTGQRLHNGKRQQQKRERLGQLFENAFLAVGVPQIKRGRVGGVSGSCPGTK